MRAATDGSHVTTPQVLFGTTESEPLRPGSHRQMRRKPTQGVRIEGEELACKAGMSQICELPEIKLIVRSARNLCGCADGGRSLCGRLARTTEPNGAVQPIRDKALPVMLMTAADVDGWLNEALEPKARKRRQ